MFKKTLSGRHLRSSTRVITLALALAAAGALVTSGCRTAPPMPRAETSQPGWTLQEGQAVWRKSAISTDIAGDILLATHPDGRSLLQFTKTPFPLVIAQASSNQWQIESPMDNRRFSRYGRPPARVLWFQLAPASSGRLLPAPWQWRASADGWQLNNLRTGERLEGYFNSNPR
jgi:hypothetical protein